MTTSSKTRWAPYSNQTGRAAQPSRPAAPAPASASAKSPKQGGAKVGPDRDLKA